jgi:hypothetical protein
MIRILAVLLSAVALFAGSLPAAAQQRQQNPNFRGPGQPSFSAKRLSGPKQPAGPRKFRSFNPPAPVGQAASPPRAFSRGLTPPTPGGPVAPRYFYPQAPTGGQNVIGLPSGVPASLPAPSLGETSPTAAPAAAIAQESAAAPGQSREAALQGDLQPPIPESLTALSEPPATADKIAPDQVIQQVVYLPMQKPVVRHVYEVRVVYVPVYSAPRLYRPHYAYVAHHGFRGHRVHFGPRFHRGFRRW